MLGPRAAVFTCQSIGLYTDGRPALVRLVREDTGGWLEISGPTASAHFEVGKRYRFALQELPAQEETEREEGQS